MAAVKVTTMDTELEFVINPKTCGRNLFIRISQNLGIREVWYFGLMYFDHDNQEVWFDSSKKSIKTIQSNACKLKYRVKFYPEDAQELIEDITIRYFYLQVRSAILSDKIYCPPDTCVLLASYAAQVRHGDFNPNKHQDGYFQKEKILPDRLFEQHHMKRKEWEKNIINMWQKHNGMLMEDAMLEYLKLAQNLEMYGVSYFDIYNKKGTHVLLGVDALGLNVYTKEDRAKLLHEALARKQAEKREQQYRDELKLLREELKNNQNNLMDAQLTIYKLQEQLRELQQAKELLEKEQKQLHEMMRCLAQSKNMEAAERNKLERQIAAKQAEVQRIQNEVQSRDAEARRLQLEIEQANHRELELRAQQELQQREQELQQLPEGASTALPSLVEVNDQLKDELKILQEQLEQTRDDTKETSLDRIHRDNLREGRDKYKTLKEIRKGNTVRRVDLFENL